MNKENITLVHFSNFLRTKKNLTISKINNKKNYKPEYLIQIINNKSDSQRTLAKSMNILKIEKEHLLKDKIFVYGPAI
ncbi:hypothetical protein BpHYR1_035351 [Brachionus plicatilis]|uniref:Uncharacterized protein n=1 Tax=Brachionus plicatilis TaxID=10195 RepID=A0A3M7R562_BRAPC|nr:hypothetical protein BpHYR1_035351 [Brachionus plicatilis]